MPSPKDIYVNCDVLEDIPKQNRDNWVKKQLLKIPRNESIIDIGAGEKRYKIYCKDLKYKSQDYTDST